MVSESASYSNLLMAILKFDIQSEQDPAETSYIRLTRGSLAKKKIMFLHSKNKASRKGYKGEC